MTHRRHADVESHVELFQRQSQHVAVRHRAVDPSTHASLHVQEVSEQHRIRHQSVGVPPHLQRENTGQWVNTKTSVGTGIWYGKVVDEGS